MEDSMDRRLKIIAIWGARLEPCQFLARPARARVRSVSDPKELKIVADGLYMHSRTEATAYGDIGG
jgi:hypothetical protein